MNLIKVLQFQAKFPDYGNISSNLILTPTGTPFSRVHQQGLATLDPLGTGIHSILDILSLEEDCRRLATVNALAISTLHMYSNQPMKITLNLTCGVCKTLQINIINTEYIDFKP